MRQRTFDVNILSQIWTLKAFLPEMIKQKVGHIVSCGLAFLGTKVYDASSDHYLIRYGFGWISSDG